jgi:paraquat-inducible protein B
MSEEPAPESARTQAAVRRGWWPGWIWAIPIAALLVVGWLGLRAATSGGEDITIVFDDVHGLKPKNTNVVYRGFDIGRVTDVSLAKDGGSVVVSANIDERATSFLRAGTQFWLRGAEPSFSDLTALAAVLTGPTIVMQPGSGDRTTHFTGRARKPILSDPREKPQIFVLSLDGSVGALQKGEPVTLRGFTVGEVAAVDFRYDANTGKIETPVKLALYPSLFPIEGTSDLRAAVDHLIGEGLRARLERDPALVGTYQVTLDIEPDAPRAAPALVNGLPQIPTAPGGGLEAVVDRVNKVPIDEIAQNALDVVRHLDALASSPELNEAITALNDSLQQIRQTARRAGPQITKLVDSLHKTAGQLDNAAQAADRVLGGAPAQNNLDKTVRQIADAARSVRELADYLDRHPEALIQGKANE